MAISAGVCNSFKLELVAAIHDFTPSTGDTFKIALYTSAAALTSATTAYSVTNEVTGAGYTAGGADLTVNAVTLTDGTVHIDFADVTWASATFTTRAALVYNSSKANRAFCVLDFGEDKVLAGSNFVVHFPLDTPLTAIARII